MSIIIVNFNTCCLTLDCINSIIEKTQNVIYEIIVVDNASSDGSVSVFQRKFPTIKILQNETNIGFGKANNLGAYYAKGTYLFLLNTDTVLINNAINMLFDFMEDESNKNVGACGANLYKFNNQPNFSYTMFYPTLFSMICHRCRVPYPLKSNESFNATGKNKDVAMIIGADLFIRKKLFTKLGGFDPLFFMYIEDTELSFRIKKMNYRIVSVAGAKIMHLQGKSSAGSSKLIMEYTGYLLFFRKHKSLLTVTVYQLIEVFFALIKLLLFFLVFKKKRNLDYYELIKFIIHQHKY